jgi:hypothetical protein
MSGIALLLPEDDLSVELQELSQLLRDTPVWRQLIAESPFLSVGAKMEALIDERSELINYATTWQARLAAINNDASPRQRVEIDRVIAKLARNIRAVCDPES